MPHHIKQISSGKMTVSSSHFRNSIFYKMQKEVWQIPQAEEMEMKVLGEFSS